MPDAGQFTEAASGIEDADNVRNEGRSVPLPATKLAQLMAQLLFVQLWVEPESIFVQLLTHKVSPLILVILHQQ